MRFSSSTVFLVRRATFLPSTFNSRSLDGIFPLFSPSPHWDLILCINSARMAPGGRDFPVDVGTSGRKRTPVLELTHRVTPFFSCEVISGRSPAHNPTSQKSGRVIPFSLVVNPSVIDLPLWGWVLHGPLTHGRFLFGDLCRTRTNR